MKITFADLESPVWLLQNLIQCPSITPLEGGALSFLERVCKELGFAVERPVFSDQNTPDIENFYARKGKKGPHLMFAGHTDVVPVGDEKQWKHPPFSGAVDGPILYGRGAVDMKGGIAAFLAAYARLLKKGVVSGSVSLLITGDEEGPAINGTVKLLEWAAKCGETWDAALVGEPTNPEAIGDMIKIGRRGSLSAIVGIHGAQGHVAYPHRADNPLPSLLAMARALTETPLDHGTDHFQPSNLELTSIDTNNPSTNVIPAESQFRFNVRYNDVWTRDTLKEEIIKRLDLAAQNRGDSPIRYSIEWVISPGGVFLTQKGKLVDELSKAIVEVTGKKPELSTSGGTSDARFIKDYCPVVEFGLVGQTMHMVDECVAIDDLEKLTKVYERFLTHYFA